jgi:hypothetical protein
MCVTMVINFLTYFSCLHVLYCFITIFYKSLLFGVSEHVQLWVCWYFYLNHVIMMYGWSLLRADATGNIFV